MPRQQVYDSVAPDRDSRIEPHRLLALGVLQRALSDATSRSEQYEKWRWDACQFLQDADGGLSFWIEVLGADAGEVRALIADALNGHSNGNGRTRKREKTNKHGPKRDKIDGAPGCVGSTVRHP